MNWLINKLDSEWRVSCSACGRGNPAGGIKFAGAPIVLHCQSSVSILQSHRSHIFTPEPNHQIQLENFQSNQFTLHHQSNETTERIIRLNPSINTAINQLDEYLKIISNSPVQAWLIDSSDWNENVINPKMNQLDGTDQPTLYHYSAVRIFFFKLLFFFFLINRSTRHYSGRVQHAARAPKQKNNVMWRINILWIIRAPTIKSQSLNYHNNNIIIISKKKKEKRWIITKEKTNIKEKNFRGGNQSKLKLEIQFNNGTVF